MTPVIWSFRGRVEQNFIDKTSVIENIIFEENRTSVCINHKKKLNKILEI